MKGKTVEFVIQNHLEDKVLFYYTDGTVTLLEIDIVGYECELRTTFTEITKERLDELVNDGAHFWSYTDTGRPFR